MTPHQKSDSVNRCVFTRVTIVPYFTPMQIATTELSAFLKRSPPKKVEEQTRRTRTRWVSNTSDMRSVPGLKITKLRYVEICWSYAEKTVDYFFSGHGVISYLYLSIMILSYRLLSGVPVCHCLSIYLAEHVCVKLATTWSGGTRAHLKSFILRLNQSFSQSISQSRVLNSGFK